MTGVHVRTENRGIHTKVAVGVEERISGKQRF